MRSAYASPIPGSAFNWSAVAVLMSSSWVPAEGFAEEVLALPLPAGAMEADPLEAELFFAVDPLCAEDVLAFPLPAGDMVALPLDLDDGAVELLLLPFL